MLRMILSALAVGIVCGVHCQVLQTQLISAAGDQVVLSESEGLLTGISQFQWSVGEIVTTTTSVGNRVYTQGLHQPLMFVQTVHRRSSIPKNRYDILVFPNPTSRTLYLQLDASWPNSLPFVISDMQGVIVKTFNLDPDITLAEIDLSGLPAGMYLLTCADDVFPVTQASYLITIIQ